MPKRGTNIYKRKDGRWEGRIRKDTCEEGGSRYISVYGKTYREAKKKMEIIKFTQKKHSLEPCKLTVEEAAKIWLEDRAGYWKQTTYATYCNIVDKHILPRLGKLKITAVNGMTVEKFISDIRKANLKKPLSNIYLHNVCAVILKIMSYVEKKYHCGLDIPENPVTQNKHSQMMLPSEESLAVLEKYLIENAQDNTNLGILLALHTGIRLGELCALTWKDINLQEEIIYISRNLQRVKDYDGQKNNTRILVQTPKTSTSLRAIPIPPVLIPLLQKYKRENADFLITGQKKAWAEPRTVQYRFEKILRLCKIEKFHFHMLRHAFATRCIARDFDVKSLSEILGHSSIQITLNLYVHSSMQRKKQLMKKFDLYLCQTCTQAV